MEFLKCRDVRWKGLEKRNKPNVVAITAKHPDFALQLDATDVHEQCHILGEIYFRQPCQRQP